MKMLRMYSRGIAISFCIALAAELVFFFILPYANLTYRHPDFLEKISMLADLQAVWLFILKPTIYMFFPCVVAYLFAVRLERKRIQMADVRG